MKSVSKRLSGSMQICLPRFWAYAVIVLRFFTTVFHCFLYSAGGTASARPTEYKKQWKTVLLVFGGRHRVGPAHGRIHWPHHRRTIQHYHLVNDLLQVGEAGLLQIGRAHV